MDEKKVDAGAGAAGTRRMGVPDVAMSRVAVRNEAAAADEVDRQCGRSEVDAAS
jgi:hypothetical protein